MQRGRRTETIAQFSKGSDNTVGRVVLNSNSGDAGGEKSEVSRVDAIDVAEERWKLRLVPCDALVRIRPLQKILSRGVVVLDLRPFSIPQNRFTVEAKKRRIWAGLTVLGGESVRDGSTVGRESLSFLQTVVADAMVRLRNQCGDWSREYDCQLVITGQITHPESFCLQRG
jgi:hypothetical protein